MISSTAKRSTFTIENNTAPYESCGPERDTTLTIKQKRNFLESVVIRVLEIGRNDDDDDNSAGNLTPI